MAESKIVSSIMPPVQIPQGDFYTVMLLKMQEHMDKPALVSDDRIILHTLCIARQYFYYPIHVNIVYNTAICNIEKTHMYAYVF